MKLLYRGKTTSLFADELRINSALPLLYNVFDSQKTVYEKQKAESGRKILPFFFFFPISPSDFGVQLLCILESERSDVLKHELVQV